MTLHSAFECSVDEQSLAPLGALIAKQFQCLTKPLVFFLQGGLGSGKTTCIRYVIQPLTQAQHIKSPTYNLIEIYTLADNSLLAHLDLYRIQDADELVFLELERFDILCIEWPERFIKYLPTADIVLQIDALDTNDKNRNFRFTASSTNGRKIIDSLSTFYAR